jgi:hypothetical protein
VTDGNSEDCDSCAGFEGILCTLEDPRQLALFGALLHGDVNPDSDVDLLATFEDDATWGLLEHIAVDQIEVHPGLFISGHGALFLPAERLAVIADPHLGYAASLGRRGAYLPTTADAQIRARLHTLLDDLAPTRLLVLGDLKHSTRGADQRERAALQETLAPLAARLELVLVRGNHDRGLERFDELAGHLTIVERWEAAGWTFVHGDRRVEAARVVAGHEHPAFEVRDALGAGFRAPCFLVGQHSVVLPAFNPFAAGTRVSETPPGGFLSPYTRSERQRCYVLEDGRLFLVGVLDP